ncbi:MAG: endo alpha-1,4 polygalactosaminidase [Polyangia bacterium]
MSISRDARCASPRATACRRWTHITSRFLPAALLMAACSQGVQEDGALGPSSEIVSNSDSATLSQDLTTPSYLYPSKLEIGRGQVSAVPLSALKVKDQSGTADTWTRYLEFTPRTDGLSATFTFTLPDAVDAAQIGSLTLQANYKGSVASVMRWSFELYDAARGSWVPATDNQGATNWSWSALTSPAQSSSARFVNGSRQLKVRMSTASAADSCDLDYLALSFVRTSQTETAVPPPPPPPSPSDPARWRPTPGTSWQIQFAGTLDLSLGVKAFDLDLVDTPKATIDLLHSRGTKVICYFSAGSWEEWRSDATSFPSSVKGKGLDGWPGERWLDVRQVDVLRGIMTKRMDLAVQKGCDAIDTDNMDVHTQDSGFKISYSQQIAYNRMLADEAHKRGMSIGLKNSLEQVPDLAELYDFAINEQCAEYGECDKLKPFISRNKAVFGIEFEGSKSSVCGGVNGLNHDTLIKNLNLDAYRVACR